VHVARPGADRVAAPARPVRGHLICVGVLSRHKGQDLLVEALADLADRDWHCVLAGSLDRDPDFVEHLQARITRLGYDHRVRLSGVLTGAALSHAYTTADLLVAPSRSETYGMTVIEALARSVRLHRRWHRPRPADSARRPGCPRRRARRLAGR
jgi:glycosyltransferase involved in cell wall biosynthesis